MTEPRAPQVDDVTVPAEDPRLLGLRRILGVMDALRKGCPWDRVQTHQSLRDFLLEETYELLEVLDAGDTQHIREELGDVLFQVVFHARVAEDAGQFDIGQVASGIAEKLHRRHPHVFQPGQQVESVEKLSRAWIEAKKKEGRRSVVDGIPKALPALLRSQRIQTKAARVGFDWKDTRGPLAKLEEELAELKVEVERGDHDRARAELGDVLFSVVNLARHMDVDAEFALREAAARFEARFRRVEATGGDLSALDIDQLEALWQAAKQELEP